MRTISCPRCHSANVEGFEIDNSRDRFFWCKDCHEEWIIKG